MNFMGETVDSSTIMSRADFDKASTFIESRLMNPESRDLVRKCQDAKRSEGERRLSLKELVDKGWMPTDEEFKETQDIVYANGVKYVEPSDEAKAQISALREAGVLTSQLADKYKQEAVHDLKDLNNRWFSVAYDWIPMFDFVRENRDLFMTDEERQSALDALNREIDWEGAKAKAKEHYDSLGSIEERVAFAKRHPDFFPEYR